MSEPWYAEGLQFSCTQCGDCCTGAPGYVWVDPDEIDALCRHLGMSSDDFGRRFLRRVNGRMSLVERPNGDCVFFDKGCTVYAARPTQCRTFPFWPENLRTAASWRKSTSSCPGTGKGRLYPVDEIEILRRSEGETST